MLSQDLIIRQSLFNDYFEDTQNEIDWYGSNFEGINRDHILEIEYLDKIISLIPKEKNSDSEGE